MGDIGNELDVFTVQPAEVAQGLVASDLSAGRDRAKLSQYEFIRARNIAERELAYKRFMKMSD